MDNVFSSDAIDIQDLYTKHRSKLLCFIRSKISNYEDAEDIMQLTYLEAIRSKKNFNGSSKPETWLFGIALNLVRNYYKRKSNSPNIEEITDDMIFEIGNSYEDDPCRLTELKVSLAKVLEDISTFTPQTRSIIEYVVNHEMSYQDAASLVGIPIGTVRSRLSRARQSLKDDYRL